MRHTVTSVKIWGGDKTKRRDEEGYMMMSLTVKGHESEPIDYKSKLVPEVGSEIVGELVPYVSGAGNHRTRLETNEYKKKENAIQNKIVAQFALRLAVEHAPDYTDKSVVMDTARYFIDCVNELTGDV